LVQVTIEPLQMAHAAELWPAVADAEMAKLWPRPWQSQADVESQFAKLLRQQDEGTAEPFLVRADGEAAGSTSFYNIQEGSMALGWTFYAPKFRRTNVNTEAKLMLLTRAFDDCGARRVQFDVDGRNVASRAAVLRLGAVQEGILRKHKLLWDGFVRDTVIFSILSNDWPKVRENLTSMLRRNQS
jgi:RimJ/RimL family protein N-acetyltransferase